LLNGDITKFVSATTAQKINDRVRQIHESSK
jgi:hypothetical protein